MMEAVTSELMEVVAVNIADVITDFESYKSYDEETLEEHLEGLGVYWLDSSDEYVVAFGDELLFDGFEEVEEAEEIYVALTNRAWEIAMESKAN